MNRQIIRLGNEILRKKSYPVEDFQSNGLASLIRDLSDTLHYAQKRFRYGHGIAAPQIDVLERVILIDTEGFKGPLINPRVVWKTDKKFEVWDSCLSFNVEFFVLVDRNYSIKVEYFDQKGEKHQLAADNNLSELLQHEIDHLDGILATDRMKKRKIMMRSEWERAFNELG